MAAIRGLVQRFHQGGPHALEMLVFIGKGVQPQIHLRANGWEQKPENGILPRAAVFDLFRCVFQELVVAVLAPRANSQLQHLRPRLPGPFFLARCNDKVSFDSDQDRRALER